MKPVAKLAVVACLAACSSRSVTNTFTQTSSGSASAGSEGDDGGDSGVIGPDNRPGFEDAASLVNIFRGGNDAGSDPVEIPDAIPAFGVYEGGFSSTRCTAGTYVGTYTGTYENAIPTVGPITLVLSQPVSASGEFVLPTSGTWNAQWGLMAGDALAPIISGMAMLVGQLDCKSNKFTAMAAPNSMYTAVGFPAGTFTLTLSGTYDPATETLSGSFSYTSNAGDGSGTWLVTLSD
jgi:hypothetical protein